MAWEMADSELDQNRRFTIFQAGGAPVAPDYPKRRTCVRGTPEWAVISGDFAWHA